MNPLAEMLIYTSIPFVFIIAVIMWVIRERMRKVPTGSTTADEIYHEAPGTPDIPRRSRRNARILAVIIGFTLPPLGFLLAGKRVFAIVSLFTILASMLLAKISASYGYWPFAFWLFPLQTATHLFAAYTLHRYYGQSSGSYDLPKINRIGAFVAGLFLAMLGYGATLPLSFYAVSAVSMSPNLIHGDQMLSVNYDVAAAHWLNQWLDVTPLERGDIVIFKHPSDDEIHVKRVVALPGDSVQFVDQDLIINNEKLVRQNAFESEGESPFRWLRNEIYTEKNQHTSYKISFSGEGPRIKGGLEIPSDAVFVMGDNRNQSIDSRFWGVLPIENIVAVPLMVSWSFKPGFNSAVRWERLGNWLRSR